MEPDGVVKSKSDHAVHAVGNVSSQGGGQLLPRCGSIFLSPGPDGRATTARLCRAGLELHLFEPARFLPEDAATKTPAGLLGLPGRWPGAGPGPGPGGGASAVLPAQEHIFLDAPPDLQPQVKLFDHTFDRTLLPACRPPVKCT